MARVYANLIIYGYKNPSTKDKKTINDVPKVLREQVKAILIEEGYPQLAE